MSSLPMNKITQTVMTPAAHAHFHHFIDNPLVRSGKIPVRYLPTHKDLPHPDCRLELGSWSPRTGPRTADHGPWAVGAVTAAGDDAQISMVIPAAAAR